MDFLSQFGLIPGLITGDIRAHVLALLTTGCLCVITFLVLAVVNTGTQIPRSNSRKDAPLGCRKLLSPTISSLADEYDRDDVSTGDETVLEKPKTPLIRGIFVYPIKSCRGVELGEVEIEGKGCKYDRDFVVAQLFTTTDEVDDSSGPDWRFITLRTFPKLAHVKIDIWEPHHTAAGYSVEAEYVRSGGCLDISFPRIVDTSLMSAVGLKALVSNVSAIISQLTLRPRLDVSFRIPYNPDPSQIQELGLSSAKVKVWSAFPTGIDMANCIPPGVLEELRHFLGVRRPITILRKDPRVARDVHRNADDIENLGYQANTGFSDSFPVNILGIASVRALETQLPQGFTNLTAARFRCNFLLSGTTPYAEELWKSIHVTLDGNGPPLLFHVTNRCTRCNLPNVDPDQKNPLVPNVLKAGQFGHNEPLNTMRKYRAVDEGAPGDPCLGMMAVPGLNTIGHRVKVGMKVRVQEEGKHLIKK